MPTNFPHWSTRAHPNHKHTSRPAMSAELLAELAARLTPRDRWLLGILREHRVLTTPQITALCFGSVRVALARLTMLYHHRALHRARPLTDAPGTAPWHWVLDDAGATILAADHAIDMRQWGWRRDHTLAVLHSTQLAHTVGANQVCVDLAAHARTTPGAQLVAWWGEARCGEQIGDIVRPDAYALWHEHGRRVEFFLEYDNGTEPVAVVAGKADRYAELASATDRHVPVLVVLPAPAREAAVHRLLPAGPPLIATTHTAALSTAGGPAGPCWLPAGHTAGRLPLAALPAVTGQPLAAAATGRYPAPDPTPPPAFTKHRRPS